MEIKYLFLLMAVPVLLIIAVAKIDTIDFPTGAAVIEESRNVLGTYSIIPFFKADIGYNLEDEYSKAIKKAENILNVCIGQSNIGRCISEKAAEQGILCKDAAPEIASIQEAFSDFVYKYKQCLNLKEENAVCRFQFYDEKLPLPKPPVAYSIVLAEENGKTRLDLANPAGTDLYATESIDAEGPFYTDFESKDISGQKKAEKIMITFNYAGNYVKISGIYSQKEKIELDYKNNVISLYKNKEQLKFIDRAVESSFRAPINKVIELPVTRRVKFCVPSGKNVYSYDQSEKKAKLQEVVYKFAVAYEEPLEIPPISFLAAEDKLKAEKSIVLKWSKPKLSDGNDFLDFSHFNVYCSRNSFKDNAGQIKLEGIPLSVKSDINYDLWNLDIKKCGSDLIEDDGDYYFAATVVSNSGKEGKAAIEAKSKSADDLAPGIVELNLLNSNDEKEIPVGIPSACITLPLQDGTGFIRLNFNKPTLNEDESTEIKFNEEFDYYVHYAKTIPLENLDVCSDIKKCRVVKQGVGFYTSQMFNKNNDIDDAASNNKFKEGEKYCFTVAAKDQKGNVMKSLAIPYNFKKPGQWLDLESKPVQFVIQ